MYVVSQKKYYEKNKEQIKEKQKEWRETNRDKIHEKDTKYYVHNSELLKERSKQYYQDHKLEIRAKQKQIYLKKKFGINTQEPTFTIRHGSFNPFYSSSSSLLSGLSLEPTDEPLLNILGSITNS